MLLKNVAGQGAYFFCVDTTTTPYSGKTGDAANITGTYSLDGAAPTAFVTANPTEIGHGIYWQPLSQAGTNGNAVAYNWLSATTGCIIHPLLIMTSGINLPVAAFGAAGGLGNSPPNFAELAIDTNGHVILQPTGLDTIIDGSYTARQALFLAASMLLGKISGLPTSPATVTDLDGTTTRAVVSFDVNNNRTNIIITPP